MAGNPAPSAPRRRRVAADARHAGWGVITGVALCCVALCVSCRPRTGVTPIQTAFNRGVYHYSNGEWDAAIAEFREALEEDPTDFRARFNLAVTLEARAREAAEQIDGGGAESRAELLRAAENQYRAVLQERPGDLRSRVNLASCLLDQGRTVEGEAILDETIQMFPDEALPRFALAARLSRPVLEGGGTTGRPPSATPGALDRAISLLLEARDIDPAHIGVNTLLGRLHVALAGDPDREKSELRAHVDAAREAYAAVLARRPDDLAALVALGRLEGSSGDHVAAVSLLRRALAIDPEHVEANIAISESHAALGDHERATLHLWRARDAERPGRRRLTTGEYRRRLLDLYGKLTSDER